MTLALGRFFLTVTELKKIKSFSTFSPSPSPPFPPAGTPPSPQTFIQVRLRVQDGLWSAKHHITGSVCPGATVSSLANLFTLALCLCVFVLLSAGVFNTVCDGSTRKKSLPCSPSFVLLLNSS